MPAITWNERAASWSPASARPEIKGKIRRHRWRPAELAAMIAGFVIFWPIGLAVLGWKLNWFGFGDWFDSKLGTNRMTPAGAGFGWGCSKDRNRAGSDVNVMRASGNLAFDGWKQAEIARLQAEFDALAIRQREFEAFLQHLREAKDREEFERFMAQRSAKPGPDGSA